MHHPRTSWSRDLVHLHSLGSVRGSGLPTVEQYDYPQPPHTTSNWHTKVVLNLAAPVFFPSDIDRFLGSSRPLGQPKSPHELKLSPRPEGYCNGHQPTLVYNHDPSSHSIEDVNVEFECQQSIGGFHEGSTEMDSNRRYAIWASHRAATQCNRVAVAVEMLVGCRFIDCDSHHHTRGTIISRFSSTIPTLPPSTGATAGTPNSHQGWAPQPDSSTSSHRMAEPSSDNSLFSPSQLR